MSDTDEITGETILDIIQSIDVDAAAVAQQTGGGIATIYVGEPHTVPAYAGGLDEDYEMHLLAIGPGWFDGPGWSKPMFSYTELCVGPDDFGEGDHDYVRTRDELVAALRKHLSAPDWRDR